MGRHSVNLGNNILMNNSNMAQNDRLSWQGRGNELHSHFSNTQQTSGILPSPPRNSVHNSLNCHSLRLQQSMESSGSHDLNRPHF